MSDSTKIFLCPFNHYHKMFEYRKWQFHITRCGDRKGKTVYTCQYNTGHLFCDLHKLIEHEAECEFKDSQKTRFDNSDPNVAKNRQPMSVYCKYEVSHVFSTIAECQEHMLECNRKEEFNKKMEQCHRKFNQNKAWIKAAQQAKREKEEQLGGNINAPASQQMPNLRYQYMMNEPFIGGVKDTVQSSHEANIHKKRVAYELDIEEQIREENMTVDEQKEKLNKDLYKKIETDIQAQGHSLYADETDTLRVKADEKVEYGLKIQRRKHLKQTLFDFNIEKTISLDQFVLMTQLDLSDKRSIFKFLEQSYLYSMTVFDDLTEGSDKLRDEWRTRSLQVLDETQMQNQVGNGQNFNCIFFNQYQGKHLNVGIENSLETHQVILFVISKETFALGKIIKDAFQSDFLLVKHELPYEMIKNDSLGLLQNPEVKLDQAHLEAIAHTRKAEIFFNEKGSSEMDLEQIRILREEKQALELDNTNLKDELNQRFNELETANKSIADKERALRHINKDIQHRDGQLRVNKTKLQELLEQISLKETQLKNSEKEIDNLKNDLKKQDIRFEKQKQRTDEFQNQKNELSIKNQKQSDLLNNANKIVRHKDEQISQLRKENEKIKNILISAGYGDQIQNLNQNSLANPALKQPNFVLNASSAKKEESMKLVESNWNTSVGTVTEDEMIRSNKLSQNTGIEPNSQHEQVTIDDSDCEAEIIDDEDDLDMIKRNKTKFELRKLQEEQKMKKQQAISKQKGPQSAKQSKLKETELSKFESNPERSDSDIGSVQASKQKNFKFEYESQTRDQLLHNILCVSCQDKPKCMLIHTCKHVPFCQSCDKDWRIMAIEKRQPLECPLCRKEYKKTSRINNYTNEQIV